jgi:hypothetical protein
MRNEDARSIIETLWTNGYALVHRVRDNGDGTYTAFVSDREQNEYDVDIVEIAYDEHELGSIRRYTTRFSTWRKECENRVVLLCGLPTSTFLPWDWFGAYWEGKEPAKAVHDYLASQG